MLLARRSEAGFILILTLLVLGALFFYSLTLVRLQAAEKRLGQRRENALVAEQAAKAGFEDAMLQISKDVTWQAGYLNTPLPHSKATYSVTFSKTQTALAYSTNNSYSSSPVTGWGGRTVPVGFVHLVSTGSFGGSTATEEGLVLTTTSPFTAALVGADKISLSGNILIDAWNSSKGTYAATKQLTGADIVTNSAAAGAVQIGSVTIYGTIAVGPGGSQSTTLSTSGQPYYLGFRVATTLRDMSVTAPPASGVSQGAVTLTGGQTRVLSPGTYSSFSATKSTIELTAGDYVVTGDLNLGSGGNILVQNGPVRLFLMGNASISSGGGFLNQTMKPSNLVLYGGSTAQTWDLQGLSGTYLYFGLNAPKAVLKFSGGNEFYGSFVAKEVYVNGNSTFHFDTATGSGSGSTGATTAPTLKARW